LLVGVVLAAGSVRDADEAAAESVPNFKLVNLAKMARMAKMAKAEKMAIMSGTGERETLHGHRRP
jgi:hypothetical protein